LWGERLTAERRRAVFYAHTLEQELRGMAADQQRARTLREDLRQDPNNLEKTSERTKVLLGLLDRKNRFVASEAAVVEPPASFDASCGEVEVADPSAPLPVRDAPGRPADPPADQPAMNVAPMQTEPESEPHVGESPTVVSQARIGQTDDTTEQRNGAPDDAAGEPVAPAGPVSIDHFDF